MTLRIIEPFAITETNIDSTNVALETAWTAGTYTLGDVRRVGERLFEVSAASTTFVLSMLPWVMANGSMIRRVTVSAPIGRPANRLPRRPRVLCCPP